MSLAHGFELRFSMPRRLVVDATRRSDKVPVFFNSGNPGVEVRASSTVRADTCRNRRLACSAPDSDGWPHRMA